MVQVLRIWSDRLHFKPLPPTVFLHFNILGARKRLQRTGLLGRPGEDSKPSEDLRVSPADESLPFLTQREEGQQDGVNMDC